MPQDFKKYSMSLASLAEQGLEERFGPAVSELIENIRDPNTEAKKKRKITITVEVEPDSERRNVTVAFDVTTTLPRAKKHSMPGFMGIDPDTRKPVIVAFDPRQGDMFRGMQPGTEHGAADAVPIDSARRAREGTT